MTDKMIADYTFLCDASLAAQLCTPLRSLTRVDSACAPLHLVTPL